MRVFFGVEKAMRNAGFLFFLLFAFLGHFPKKIKQSNNARVFFFDKPFFLPH